MVQNPKVDLLSGSAQMSGFEGGFGLGSTRAELLQYGACLEARDSTYVGYLALIMQGARRGNTNWTCEVKAGAEHRAGYPGRIPNSGFFYPYGLDYRALGWIYFVDISIEI